MADTTFSDATGTPIVAAWANDVNSAVYKAASAIAGTSSRTAISKFADVVSVKDFGAIGTNVAGNVTADTAAFVAALASGKNVYIPEGTYFLSSSLTIGAGVKLYGAGRGKTVIYYTGTAHAMLLGSPGPTITLTYDCELGGFTLICTNRASTVKGILVQNAVYFKVFDITSVGSGNPNSGVAADWVLYGEGLSVTDNSILGTIERVSCRIWNYGYFFWTRSTSASNWCAAIEVRGGEVANNMYGIVVGDPAVAYSTAVGVSFRDIWVQGNYTTGIKNYAGESTLFDNIYFEGNANYDYDLGGGTATPVKNMLHRSVMTTESIGTTNYGTFPYLNKVRVRNGSFNSIVDNDMSISTAISLVQIDAGVSETRVKDNRLNSTAATTARLLDNTTTTISLNNSPEAPRYSAGVITRLMTAASGSVATTGLGFRPVGIRFWGGVDAGVSNTDGYAVIGIGLQQRCLSTDSANNVLSSSNCIQMIRGAGNKQEAVVTSFDADGFTLSWTKTGAPAAETATINFEAWR
jgi:hypothetical protein